MNKYLRFIILGVFFLPNPIYWVILAICVSVIAITVYARDNIDLNECMDAEQPYKVTVGYIIENHIAVPKKVYYTEKGKQIPIPLHDTSIKGYDDNIYEIYTRIRRKDGTGYDYVFSTMKRLSDTNFKELQTSCGKELGT